MTTEWRSAPLSELYDIRSGLSKPRSAFGSGYPFLSFKDVFYNYFVPDELSELVQSTDEERRTCSIRRGDVFLTRTSETREELGMSCVALADHEGATFNGFTKRLRPKPGTSIVPEYAAYFLRSDRFRRDVTAMSALSTRASLNNEMLGRLVMALPPPSEQVEIGQALKAFDDKIELNRRMSETLEAIARALFRSWFVDFDPVRANAEGRDPGVPGEVVQLFPASFDLGDVPAGWIEATLGDVAGHPRRGVKPGDVDPSAPYIALEHMPRRSIMLEDWAEAAGLASNKFGFERGEVLFGKLRPYFHKVGVAPIDGICSTDIVVVRPTRPEWFSFVVMDDVERRVRRLHGRRVDGYEDA
jgi:type I restriction enzyme S subunit